MPIGNKIKEFRVKNSLTQKDLADKLNVTYQAVSRWENNESEPSFDTVRQMTQIFGCSADELLSVEKPVEEPKEEVQEEKKPEIVIQPQKQLISLCSKCGRAIYEEDDLRHVEETISTRSGRTTHKEKVTKPYCKDCDEKRIESEKKEKEQAEITRKDGIKTRRIHSFVWPSMVLAVTVAIGIYGFVTGKEAALWGSLIGGVVLFTLIGCFILNNNFVGEMWLEILSWGFVKMPGVIFSLDFDGFVFLIVVKILFFILGIVLAVGAAALATALAGLCSIFVYPYALSKNLKNID